MFYSANQIEELETGYRTQVRKLNTLLMSTASQSFENKEALYFLKHGLGRRIILVNRALQGLFTSIPIALDEIPKKEKLSDASIYLQALFSNIYGCLDNLAWIWVHNNQQNKKLANINKHYVGLNPENKTLRQTLPEIFLEELEKFDDWIKYIKDVRNDLAHKVPLYLIPSVIHTEKVKDFESLENKKLEALILKEIEAFEKIESEQSAMSSYRPYWAEQSIKRTSAYLIHPCAINDVNALTQLVEKFFEYCNSQGRA